jgi:RHS repeat-associated protein
MIKGGATYRIVSDHLGSPRLVFDVETGAIAQRIDYDEFGRVIADTNPGFQPFGFGGGLYDQDTKLVHFAAREYDPEFGRWTTREPIPFVGGDSNLYEYAFGDPINFLDRNGLGSDLVLINPLDQRGLRAIRGGLMYKSAQDEYVVDSHGQKGVVVAPSTDWGSYRRPLSPDQLARIIELGFKDWPKSRGPVNRVKLLACSIDKRYAEELATELGIPVLYSPKSVWGYDNGTFVSADKCDSSGCKGQSNWQTALPLSPTLNLNVPR